jgi:hypothetical protein
MDTSRPSTFTVILPAGLSEEAVAHVLHVAWSSGRAVAAQAGLNDRPRLELESNCPDPTYLQEEWERDGREAPWELS